MPKSRAHKEEKMPEAVMKMKKRGSKKPTKKATPYKKGGVVKRGVRSK